MSKGHHGETCAEAFRDVVKRGELLSYQQLFERVRPRGEWTDVTIRRHAMSLVVNLLPAREEWPSRVPFLFLHGDGRYEVYDSRRHPEVSGE